MNIPYHIEYIEFISKSGFVINPKVLSTIFILTSMRWFLVKFSKTLHLPTVDHSNSYRGKERKEKRGESPTVREKIKGKAKTSVSWARLINKIFEVDPLLCPKCGKAQ